MHAFVILLFTVTVTHAAPQGGYNYQSQVETSQRNEFTEDQFQLLQQYAHQQVSHQQQQPQKQLQLLEAPQLSQASQTLSHYGNNNAGGNHFESRLFNQVQLVNNEVQEHQHEKKHQNQNVQTKNVIDTQDQLQQKEHVENMKQVVLTQPDAQTLNQVHSQPQSQQYIKARHQEVYQNHRPKSVQYNKEFFYLSAPQEDFEQPKNLDDQLDTLKKNIRVVFIRAPENNNVANAAIQLAKQSFDQQTVVYVLTKQHDASELANKLHKIRAETYSKPDVVFIKYRTPEEAEHAQRTIQAQYEALDGPNHFNHEGVAPTHNFIGLPSGSHSSSNQIDPRNAILKVAELEAPSTKYLPASDTL